MADTIADFGMVHSYVVVKANDPYVKARELYNRWEGINIDNIDGYLDEITELHRLTCIISTNVEYTRDMHGVMPFLQGKYSKINGIIDCYNDYLKHNQFVQLKYKPLEKMDLDGVLVIGKTVKEEIPIKPIVTEHDKKVKASKTTYVWRNVL
jgi:hypothetical protein